MSAQYTETAGPIPTTSQEAERVRELFRAIDAQRWEVLRDLFTPEVVYERPGYEPLRGIEAVLHFYRETRIVAEGRHELWHVVGGESTAACWGRFAGRARDGRVLDERFADVYTLEEGRIATRATHFFRPAI